MIEIKIVFSKNFEGVYERLKAEILSVKKEATSIPDAQPAITSTVNNAQPYTEVRNDTGYFKFFKQGENIEIGGKDTRRFRLLQCLCNPFGVPKTIEAIFEAIRMPKDKNDSDLTNWSPQRTTKILTLIEYAKKELQKNKKLQGKLKYRMDNQKRNMWLEVN